MMGIDIAAGTASPAPSPAPAAGVSQKDTRNDAVASADSSSTAANTQNPAPGHRPSSAPASESEESFVLVREAPSESEEEGSRPSTTAASSPTKATTAAAPIAAITSAAAHLQRDLEDMDRNIQEVVSATTSLLSHWGDRAATGLLSGISNLQTAANEINKQIASNATPTSPTSATATSATDATPTTTTRQPESRNPPNSFSGFLWALGGEVVTMAKTAGEELVKAGDDLAAVMGSALEVHPEGQQPVNITDPDGIAPAEGSRVEKKDGEEGDESIPESLSNRANRAAAGALQAIDVNKTIQGAQGFFKAVGSFMGISPTDEEEGGGRELRQDDVVWEAGSEGVGARGVEMSMSMNMSVQMGSSIGGMVDGREVSEIREYREVQEVKMTEGGKTKSIKETSDVKVVEGVDGDSSVVRSVVREETTA
ncbi:hypothetical protein HK101_010009 [Irineochytrium annulatum]|nr:hypothetical protein HK101_010009 [Irineochytrium annulatum]